MLKRASSGSYAGSSAASSRSSASRRARADNEQDEGHDLLHRRSSFEGGIFGVLFTLSKENSDTRPHIKWVLVKVFIDGWQMFTTIIMPDKQPWRINANSTTWAVVSVLNFSWLSHLGYGAYLAVLYSMVVLLAVNVAMCVWVAWCFKEHKFPVVWPIKVLRVFSSVFFQAFDVTSLNLLQLGFSCRFTGSDKPHMHFDLFPAHSCTAPPHLIHAVVSALSLVLFVAIALLLNMAEVEVNPKSRRPLALGHSGAEVMVFGIKTLITLVDVFIGWTTVSSCFYMALSLALAWQYIRWNPSLVAWMNYLKSGVATAVVWACAMLMLLVFHPGIKADRLDLWHSIITKAMLIGLAPAFGAGVLASRGMIRYLTNSTLRDLADANPEVPLEDVCRSIDDPRDIEVVIRCCRVWRDQYNLDADAVNKAQGVIKAGLAMFPTSPYMVLLHANFMIDVLGVSQSGNARIEDAGKLNPGLMCRFIMFVRQQQATQSAAGKSANDVAHNHMDLLGYVEYQRKQRMVVRLHREALQAMCNFWKALDAHKVSFKHLSRALVKIENSVSQAQAAYRVVLESYGNNSKLVRLYGRFLQTVKNDPWGAAEYFTEADRLEETKDTDSNGPLLPDGTPLARMDDMDTAVLVISANGDVQMANKQTFHTFGYKRGMLEGKPMSALLAPHCSRWLSDQLSELVAASGFSAAPGAQDSSRRSRVAIVVGMHYDRLAFRVKLSLSKASGVGEDSTFIALLEPVPPAKNVSCIWVAQNGTIAACDPQFVSAFGWKPHEVNGAGITAFFSVPTTVLHESHDDDEEAVTLSTLFTASPSDVMARIVAEAPVSSAVKGSKSGQGLQGFVMHKYDGTPAACLLSVAEGIADTPVHEIRIKLLAMDSEQLLVANRKGVFQHVSSELALALNDAAAARARHTIGAEHPGGHAAHFGATGGPQHHRSLVGTVSPALELLSGYTLADFLPPPWKDMHTKFLKDTTTIGAPGRGQWSCRAISPPGPTLELRTAGGKPLYMQVSVTTTDMEGELAHVVRMKRSSLEAALAERRMRLSLSSDGLITGVHSGASNQLFGLEPSQIAGRGLWEIIEDFWPTEDGSRATPGPWMLKAVVSRTVANPGHSWRVRVVPPLARARTARDMSLAQELEDATRESVSKLALMQLHIEAAPGTGGGKGPSLFVDLWPTYSVSGVLELDATGCVTAVMEAKTRPAGLLFGLPSHMLVGTAFCELVALPPGRNTPGDLLSLYNTKKSNLKTSKKEASVKAGPVHVLQAAHSDGQPLMLEVQIVGRPGPNQPTTAILRPYNMPLLPSLLSSAVDPAARPSAFGRQVSRMPDFRQPPVPSPGRPPNVPPQEALPPRSSAGAGGGGDTSLRLWDALEEEAEQQPSCSARVSTPAAGAGSRPTISPDAASPAAVVSPPKTPSDPPALPPSPPDVLGTRTSDGLPLPGVTAGKAAALAGRSKLADLVKAAEGERVSLASGGSEGPRLRASGRFAGTNAGEHIPLSRLGTSPSHAPGVTASPTELLRSTDDLVNLAEEDIGGETEGLQTAMDVESVAESDDDSGAKAASKKDTGTDRVSAWVASKGAFFQNTANAARGDDEIPARPGRGPGSVLDAAERGGQEAAASNTAVTKDAGNAALRTRAGVFMGSVLDDDDARSEGGASAASGQSASTMGAESGRRFRKLAKLMNSSQAQQVQERLRAHSLITVAILAAVHVICFALIIVAIKNQRNSMLQLGRNVEAVRYMQMVMTDVRSLDIIARNKSLPNLYTQADVGTMVQRIASNGNEIKIRLNAIVDSNHDPSSPVVKLLFYSPFSAWAGQELNGTDIYANCTVWEALTRFYAMSANVVQDHDVWVQEGMVIARTAPGQYLLKTGPALYSEFRKTTDALLYETVTSVHTVDNLQLIFLAIEGCAASFFAACYLAYLLRSVSDQRLSLYKCFLLIPVGLTRVLASQNTTLLVDEDDESEAEEEAERMGIEEDKDGGMTKSSRHATLNVTDQGYQLGGGTETGYTRSRSGGHRPSFNGIGSPRPDASSTEQKNMRARSSSLAIGNDGCWATFKFWLRRIFTWRSSTVSPLPSVNGPSGLANGTHPSKRVLKDDSHETIMMLLPFIVWSALVIAFYVTAVVHMKGMVEVVGIHSVVNRISARTYQSIFFGQELANVEDPALLPTYRAKLLGVIKLARDAWLTLQLGSNAYLAGGNATEQFPLVKHGIVYASPALSELMYGTGKCLRMQDHLPCPGPSYRYYQITHTGLDSMMQQFLMTLTMMATNKSTVPGGLGDAQFDFVYNVGHTDLVDGTIQLRLVHYDLIVQLFQGIMLLHIILFLLLWVIFFGFIIFLLNPLLKRVVKERRRIAELMSQLPPELDVERLIARALGTTSTAAIGAGGVAGGGGGAAAPHSVSETGFVGGDHDTDYKTPTMTKWRAILRGSTPQNKTLTSASGVRVG